MDPPFNFFYFATEWMLEKSQRVPPLTFFWHYATYQKLQKNRKKLENVFPHSGTAEESTEVLLLFLSLRYGANFGRSRLVKT